MNDGETMRLIVAERQVPRIAREARTPDDAVRIVRRAVENNPTLVAMGENRVGEEEAEALAGRVLDAAAPAARRVLARRRLARRGVSRGIEEQVEEFMDDLERDLRERGEL